MGYIGAKTIKELHEKANFIEISASGLEESHPHDITTTRAAPNYQGNYKWTK
jgi:IMP dehydrogenase